MRTIKSFLKRLFCAHKWIRESAQVFDIRNGHGNICGQVTLSIFHCSKCGRDELIPHDKIMFPNS